MAKIQLKNRTSSVDPAKTAAQIEAALVQAGATTVQKRYEAGELCGIDFVLPSPSGLISFRLPVNVDAAYKVLCPKVWLNEKRKKAIRAQAARTAWRLALDDVLVQLSKILLGQTEAMQAFFPYVLRGDRTLFDAFKREGFAALALPAPEDRE